jgi:hypothetical protein
MREQGYAQRDRRKLLSSMGIAPPSTVAATDGESIVVFVEGPLHNPMNGSRGTWHKHARWARQWRERTGMVLLAERGRGRCGPRWPWPSSLPKLVLFMAHTGATWDDDNLRAGMKPLRDALKDAGIIDDDKPRSGHIFSYSQRIDRAHRGVRITIAPRE